jgi:hypothetical protein
MVARSTAETGPDKFTPYRVNIVPGAWDLNSSGVTSASATTIITISTMRTTFCAGILIF